MKKRITRPTPPRRARGREMRHLVTHAEEIAEMADVRLCMRDGEID